MAPRSNMDPAELDKVERHLKLLVSSAFILTAADLHFTATIPVDMRINGDIKVVPTEPGTLFHGPINASMIECVFMILAKESPVYGGKTPEENAKALRSRWMEKRSALFSATYGLDDCRVRLRIMAMFDNNGPRLVIRLLPEAILPFSKLGFEQTAQNRILDMLNTRRGLFIVTGPTGSGKSTTLAAINNQIAKTYARHIYTLEDPIEYAYTVADGSKATEEFRSIVTQREIGTHVADWHVGLEDALRSDPDIIVVGEIRTAAAMNAVLKAAESGHLVFATLHSTGAVETVDRILNMFSSDERPRICQLLAQLLLGVVSQSLVEGTESEEIVGNRKEVKEYGAVKRTELLYEILVVRGFNKNDPSICNALLQAKVSEIRGMMNTSTNCFKLNDRIEALLKQGKVDAMIVEPEKLWNQHITTKHEI